MVVKRPGVQEAVRAAKAEEKRAEEAAAREREAAKGKKQVKEVDRDPDGAQLAAVADPLAEAAKLLQKLRDNGRSRLQTHLLSFEVALRRGKQLLALQAVKRAAAEAGEAHPDVHRMAVRFCTAAAAPHPAQNGTPKVRCQKSAGFPVWWFPFSRASSDPCCTHAAGCAIGRGARGGGRPCPAALERAQPGGVCAGIWAGACQRIASSQGRFCGGTGAAAAAEEGSPPGRNL